GSPLSEDSLREIAVDFWLIGRQQARTCPRALGRGQGNTVLIPVKEIFAQQRIGHRLRLHVPSFLCTLDKTARTCHRSKGHFWTVTESRRSYGDTNENIASGSGAKERSRRA